MLRHNPPLAVDEYFEKNREACGLTQLTPINGNRRIGSYLLHRPGLAFAGFYKVFPAERVQVIGNTEHAYLRSLSAQQQRIAWTALLKEPIPAVVFTSNRKPSPSIVALCKEYGVPLFISRLSSQQFMALTLRFLEEYFAPRTTVHGTLVDVYNVGMLFTGISGIGKSECALDLICRGHLLVADDAVHVVRYGSKLTGFCDERLRHHMEIRGAGIIDIGRLYGMRALRPKKRIDVVVELVSWHKNGRYDRTGLDEKTMTILGLPIHMVTIPMSQGKNISAIAEAIARNMHLRFQGINPALEFNQKLIFSMQNTDKSTGSIARRKDRA